MQEYRNIIYGGGGYNPSFANTTIGVGRREYIKKMKKEIIGFLDLSFPTSINYLTKYSFRKGIQFDLYKKGIFRLPLSISSSSILRSNSLVKYDDITAELNCIPGIYTEQYTLAIDIRYQLIAFRHIKYSQKFKDKTGYSLKDHWENPYYNSLKLGLMAGLNFKRFAYYIKTGYEQSSHLDKKYFPWYLVLGVGFKWGNRAFNAK